MKSSALVLAGVVLVAGCASGRPVRTVPAQPGPGRSASVHVLGVPPGQLPRVGQCRVWVRGVPPGRQARSRSCAGILVTAPAGAMILYRPSRNVVRVRYVHEARVGVVVVVRMFDESGNFVREEQPTREDRDEDDDRGRGRGRP